MIGLCCRATFVASSTMIGVFHRPKFHTMIRYLDTFPAMWVAKLTVDGLGWIVDRRPLGRGAVNMVRTLMFKGQGLLFSYITCIHSTYTTYVCTLCMYVAVLCSVGGISCYPLRSTIVVWMKKKREAWVRALRMYCKARGMRHVHRLPT